MGQELGQFLQKDSNDKEINIFRHILTVFSRICFANNFISATLQGNCLCVCFFTLGSPTGLAITITTPGTESSPFPEVCCFSQHHWFEEKDLFQKQNPGSNYQYWKHQHCNDIRLFLNIYGSKVKYCHSSLYRNQ